MWRRKASSTFSSDRLASLFPASSPDHFGTDPWVVKLGRWKLGLCMTISSFLLVASPVLLRELAELWTERSSHPSDTILEHINRLTKEKKTELVCILLWSLEATNKAACYVPTDQIHSRVFISRTMKSKSRSAWKVYVANAGNYRRVFLEVGLAVLLSNHVNSISS